MAIETSSYLQTLKDKLLLKSRKGTSDTAETDKQKKIKRESRRKFLQGATIVGLSALTGIGAEKAASVFRGDGQAAAQAAPVAEAVPAHTTADLNELRHVGPATPPDYYENDVTTASKEKWEQTQRWMKDVGAYYDQFKDEDWEVRLNDPEGRLDYTSAAGLAQRLAGLIAKLPPYEMPNDYFVNCSESNNECERQLAALIEELSFAIQREGFSEEPVHQIEGFVSKFDDMGDMREGVAATARNTPKDIQDRGQEGKEYTGPDQPQMRVGSAILNPLHPRYHDPGAIATVTHELLHLAGGKYLGNIFFRDQNETTAEAATAEVLAGLVEDDRMWALEPLLVHLLDMARAVAELRAFEAAFDTPDDKINQEPIRNFITLLSQIYPESPIYQEWYSTKLNVPKEKLQKRFHDRMGTLQRYCEEPLKIIMKAVKAKDHSVTGLMFPVQGETSVAGAEKDGPVRVDIFDDLPRVLNALDFLVEKIARRGYK